MNKTKLPAVLALCLWGSIPPVTAQSVSEQFLPPPLEWNGKSRELVTTPDDPWITPFEKSGLEESPGYAITMAWFKRLVAAAPELSIVSIGKSWEGRDIFMIIASKEGADNAKDLKASGKPLMLAHAGIHAGEIDGKDAGMMLLRDLSVGGKKKALLDRVNLLFIPILSVDGHERASRYNRINQRGPRIMGWRTNGRNLNLNRDFAKLETPEVQHLIRMINEFEPDLYFDIHVTDGIDYQYDITYGFTGVQGSSPAGASWMEEILRPALNRELRAQGHIPGPLIFATNNSDLGQGIVDWTAGPRFSNSYGDARHLPTVLVENHSLKPFGQRVLGTYVLLESAMRVLGENGAALHKATVQDKTRRPERVNLTFKAPNRPPETIDFLGVSMEKEASHISGTQWVRWQGKPETVKIPFIKLHEPALTVARPKGYWVPSDWPEIIEKLAIHGVRMERLTGPREVEMEMYRIRDAKLGAMPYEGRVQVTGKAVAETRKMLLPAGSAWVPTDQPACELIVLLLEPDSPDSFFQWGFFHEILQRTEYFENYALEPLARKMMENDPALKAEFEAKLEQDEGFAKDPSARLDFFYSKSPYVDDRYLLYPVGRVPLKP